MMNLEFEHKTYMMIFQMNDMSMSHAIQKLIPMEENQSLIEYNRANATKVLLIFVFRFIFRPKIFLIILCWIDSSRL